MSEQERTIAYSPEDHEEMILPDQGETMPADQKANDPEELSDAEYAEIIGEETQEPDTEPESIETEEKTVPTPSDAHETVKPVTRKNRKRRKSAHTETHTDINRPKEKEDASHRHLHNIGGVDTLKTTGKEPAGRDTAGKETPGNYWTEESKPAGTETRPSQAKPSEPVDRETQPVTKQDSVRHETTPIQKKETVRSESPSVKQTDSVRPEADAERNRTSQKQTQTTQDHALIKEDTPDKRPAEPISREEQRRETRPKEARSRETQPKEDPVQERHLKTSQPGHFLQDMERGGNASFHAARSYLSGRETAEQNGTRALRRYGRAAGDAVGILAAAGGKAVSRQQQFNSRQFTEGAVHAEQVIKAGLLRREDLLLSKKVLREKLKKAGAQNLPKSDQWGIVKNRRAIYDALVVKEELIRIKDTAPDQKHVFARTKVAGKNVIGISRRESKKQVKILTSEKGKLFNDFKYGAWTQNMISVYFQRHEDPMLRRINPARMRIKELKRLLKLSERYRLKPMDIAMIRTLIRGKTAMKNRAADRFSGLAGSFRSVRAITRRGVRLLEETDDATAEGVRHLTTVYHGVRTVKPAVHLAGTAAVKTVGAVWHLPPVTYARNAAMKPVHKAAEATSAAVRNVGGKAADRVKTVAGNRILKAEATDRLSGATARKLVRTAGEPVKTIRRGKTAVKKSTGRISRRMKKIRNSRAGRLTGFIGRRIMGVLHVTTAPVRWTAIGFFKIHRGIQKIIAAVLATFFAVILIFLVLLMFSAFLTSVGNSTGEVVEKVVTDNELAEHIRHLNERNLAKFQEAIDIVKAGPQHDSERIDRSGRYPDETYGGEKLYYYGSPKNKYAPEANLYHNDLDGEVPGGFHYIYLDSHGQMIGNNTNNTKDIICLTSVMVGNDYDEEVLTLAPELMDIWFDYLNPAPSYTVSELYHKEGTDLFPHDVFTFDGKTYYCNDSSFYAAYDAARTDGVYFYEAPVPQTTEGCRTDWDRFWEDYNDWWDDCPEYPDYPDPDDYEDRDAWEEARDVYYEALEEYRRQRDYWYDMKPDSDDYLYCPGHDALSCSYGYRDVNVYVTILNKEDVFAAADNGNVITYCVPADYTCSTWETRTVSLDIPAAYADVIAPFVRDQGWKNPKHQEWCNNLYAGDWFSLYGVDTYEDSVSLPTGEGRLSQEQIDEMIERIGDVSAARQAIVSFALDYVGRIPYYWGGKPSVPGYEGNNFGSIVEADYKGRNRKGLDCSGFVGWVYWSVTGLRPCPVLSTANIVPALGLRRIGFDELMPGDIGMEALPGAGSNHIGYFVGYNEDGRARWVHESSGAGNVAVNTANCFRYYYRLFED